MTCILCTLIHCIYCTLQGRFVAVTCWDIGQLHWKAKLKPQSELEQASAAESAPLELASQILLFFSIL